MLFLKSLLGVGGLSLVLSPLASWAVPIAEPGSETQVEPPLGDDTFIIRGGAVSGDRTNIFHSFQEFGLDAGQTANFIPEFGVENIFGRVVGGNPSIIDGTLQVSESNANLFLMNPAGLVFGPNANLNVPASFIATTANGIEFGQNNYFEATEAFNASTLSGFATGLRFNQELGSILNFGDLVVGPGQTIGLVATNILTVGSLTSPGGNIVIAGVNASPDSPIVNISSADMLLSFDVNSELLTSGVSSIATLLTGSELGPNVASEVEKTAGGEVRLVGSGVIVPNEHGLAITSGEIDASSPTGLGGNVAVFGQRVGVLGAQIDVSGTRGGMIAIGGYWQFGTAPESIVTFIDENSSIIANSSSAATGGLIVAEAHDTLRFAGEATVRGRFGKAGTVALSGRETLHYLGDLDVGSDFGEPGRSIFNSRNIVIIPGGTPILDPSSLFSKDPDGYSAFEGSAFSSLEGRVQIVANNEMYLIGADVISSSITLLQLWAGRRINATPPVRIELSSGEFNVRFGLTANNFSSADQSGYRTISLGNQLPEALQSRFNIPDVVSRHVPGPIIRSPNAVIIKTHGHDIRFGTNSSLTTSTSDYEETGQISLNSHVLDAGGGNIILDNRTLNRAGAAIELLYSALFTNDDGDIIVHSRTEIGPETGLLRSALIQSALAIDGRIQPDLSALGYENNLEVENGDISINTSARIAGSPVEGSLDRNVDTAIDFGDDTISIKLNGSGNLLIETVETGDVGNINIDGRANIEMGTGDIIITASSGDVDLSESPLITNGGNVSIEVTKGSIIAGIINTSSDTQSGGNITLESDANITTAGLTSQGLLDGGNVTIRATERVNTTNGIINAIGGRNGGDISITTGTSIDTANILTGTSGFGGDSGNINLDSQGTINTSLGALLTDSAFGTGGDILLVAPLSISVADISASSFRATGGSIDIDSGTGISLNGGLSTNNNSINLDGDIVLLGDSHITLEEGDDLTIPGLISGSFDLSLVAPDSAIVLSASLNQGDLLNDINIQTQELRLLEEQTFEIRNTGDLEISTDINFPGNLSLETSGGSIRVQDLTTSNASQSGHIDLRALRDIETGNISTEGIELGTAGNVQLNTGIAGRITIGNVVTSSAIQSGDISLISPGDIVAGYISTEVSQLGISNAQGKGGKVDVVAGHTFRVLTDAVDSFGQPSSIAAFGPESSGLITIIHGGNGDIPFVIGDAQVNGTVARIQRSDNSEGVIQNGSQYLFTHRQDSDRIQIISVDGPESTTPETPETLEVPDDRDAIDSELTTPESTGDRAPVPLIPPPPPGSLSEEPSSHPETAPPPALMEGSMVEEMTPSPLPSSGTDPDAPLAAEPLPPTETEIELSPEETPSSPPPSFPELPEEIESGPILLEPPEMGEPPEREPTGDPIIDLANLIGDRIGFETSFQEQDNQLGITWTGEDGTVISQGVPLTPTAPETDSTPIAITTDPVLIFPPPPPAIATVPDPTPPLLSAIAPVVRTAEDTVQTQVTPIAITTRDIQVTEPITGNIAGSSPTEDDADNGTLSNQISVENVFGSISTAEELGTAIDAGSAEDAVTLADSILEAQYENFFGQDLTNEVVTIASIQELLTTVEAETGDRGTIVYALPFSDHLSIIAVSANQSPTLINLPISYRDLTTQVDSFVRTIADVTSAESDYKSQGQALYQLLIEPLEEHFSENGTQTAVFALHGDIQGIPLAALHDGEQYLIEKLNLGLIPSISLTDKRYAPVRESRLLAMGSGTFQPDLDQEKLPAVPVELDTITSLWPDSRQVANENFTLDHLLTMRASNRYGLVHLATHARFEPVKEGERATNIPKLYFWNDVVGMKQLREHQWVSDENPLELLVLSACQTLLGDYQWGEFGFAGLAVNSGAKSVIGSRWRVSDAATLAVMGEFYDVLRSAPVKAYALREAQLALLHRKVRIKNQQLSGVSDAMAKAQSKAQFQLELEDGVDFSHPFYWSAFDIVGLPW